MRRLVSVASQNIPADTVADDSVITASAPAAVRTERSRPVTRSPGDTAWCFPRGVSKIVEKSSKERDTDVPA